MGIHNYRIDYAVAVTDERVGRLLREKSLQPGPGPRAPEPRIAGRRPEVWTLRLVLAEPLIVGLAGFLLGWLVS